MIIWSGRGGIVVLIAILVFSLSVVPMGVYHAAFEPAGSGTSVADRIILALSMLGGAALSYYLVMALHRNAVKGEPRVLVDQRTGQEVLLTRSSGSLFFIPTRFWAYILALIFVAIGIAVGPYLFIPIP